MIKTSVLQSAPLLVYATNKKPTIGSCISRFISKHKNCSKFIIDRKDLLIGKNINNCNVYVRLEIRVHYFPQDWEAKTTSPFTATKQQLFRPQFKTRAEGERAVGFHRFTFNKGKAWEGHRAIPTQTHWEQTLYGGPLGKFHETLERTENRSSKCVEISSMNYLKHHWRGSYHSKCFASKKET